MHVFIYSLNNSEQKNVSCLHKNIKQLNFFSIDKNKKCFLIKSAY